MNGVKASGNGQPAVAERGYVVGACGHVVEAPQGIDLVACGCATRNGPSQLVREVNGRARERLCQWKPGMCTSDGRPLTREEVEALEPGSIVLYPSERPRLDWWGIGKGVVLGTLLGMAVVGVVAMPFEAAMVGLAVAGVLTLACMLVGGMCAEAGRRMGIVSSGQ